jgi:hypothetical protein
MTVAIELTPHQAEILAAAAARLNIAPAQLAAAAVRDLISTHAGDFEAAASRVMEKNRELYQRLS